MLDARTILKATAAQAGLKADRVAGRSKEHSVALVRQRAMFMTRRLLAASHHAVGRRFGRHHSTVIFAIQKIEERLRTLPEERAAVAAILGALDVDTLPLNPAKPSTLEPGELPTWLRRQQIAQAISGSERVLARLRADLAALEAEVSPCAA